MPKHQSSNPKDVRTYNKGANRDVEDELLASDSGSYVDAHNMRPSSMDGDAGAIKKIKGELPIFPLIDNRALTGTFLDPITGYCSIGVIEVNDAIVEFWANKTGLDTIVRINGIIVLWDKDADDADKIGFSCDFPLQMDKDESCDFGTVFVTDNNVPPIYFDIEDLLTNAGLIRNNRLSVKVNGFYDATNNFIKSARPLNGFSYNSPTDKYYGAFKRDIFDITNESGLDIPVFVGLTDNPSGGEVFGNLGLPVGIYQYSIRYVNESGERTQWSHSTGFIPVPSVLSDDNKYYSSPLTEGGTPDITVGLYAVNLKLRITNDFGYESIEIKRTSYNSGDILGAESGQDIIARISILPAPDKPISFFDNGAEPIEAVSGEDSIGVNSVAKRAKGIRFHNNRIYLMNVELSDRVVPKNLSKTVDAAGNDIISIGSTIQKIYKEAYNNPKNFESYKTYLSKEGYKWGFVGYDVNGEITYVKGIGGYQFPDRRDELSGDSLDTSYSGFVDTLNSTGVKSPTHEVFEHWDAISRKQIHSDIAGFGVHGILPTEDHYTVEGGIATGSSEKNELIQGYNQNSLVYDVNKVRFPTTPVVPMAYNPKCFGLDYYAKGVYIKGIDNVNSADFKDIKSFAIVRTESVNHVLAQGIGVYKFNQSVDIMSPSVKAKDSFVFYSPDTDGKISINPLLMEKVIKTPSNYKIEVSSPLGFFSDVYNHYPASNGSFYIEGSSLVHNDSNRLNASSKEGDNNVDQLLFARIQRDKNGSQSKINPMELNLGTDGGDGYKYVDYGKFRGDIYASIKNRSRTIKIKSAEINTSGHGLIIELHEDLYDNTHYDSSGSKFLKYSDPLLKNFHEPFYIINIVRNTDTVNVSLDSSETFQETGTYIKKESFIGITNGITNTQPYTPAQEFELTYERFEDITPDVLDENTLSIISSQAPNNLAVPLLTFWGSGNHKNNAGNAGYQNVRRFVYVDGDKWVNIASLTKTEYDAAVLNLSNNIPYQLPNTGEIISGIFFSTTKDNIFWNVVFRNNTGLAINDKVFIPTAGKKVSVRYNTEVPIRVFGGDGNIGENIFNMMENNFVSCPMPYPAYMNKDRCLVQASGFSQAINNSIMHHEDIYRTLADLDTAGGYGRHLVSRIRQMAVMFCCESRTNTNFLFSKNDPEVKRDGFFPNLNIDPSMAERADKTDQANMSIPVNPSINTDFSRDSKFRKYSSISEFAVKSNKTSFCTRAIWSLPKNIGQVDTPSLRTFPALNYYDLPESTGEIKKAWSALTGRGSNLYAITEEGTALLLTNKTTLSGAEGNDLTFIGGENDGVRDHLWISKTIGMDKQFWRTHAEFEGSLYWANKESVFKLDGNKLVDIAKGSYHSKIYPEYLSRLDGGYNTAGELAEQMTGFYDRYHNEYWVTFNGYKACPENTGETILPFTSGSIQDAFTLSYSEITDKWVGTYGYNFDKYVSSGNKSYGIKGDDTYELNIGNTINGADITSHVIGISVPNQIRDKEFVRLRVNSDVKPSSIEFFKDLSEFQNTSPITILASTELKNHFGFEQYIPRQTVNRNRVQGRILLFDMINNTDPEFKIVDSEITYKVLK